MWRRHNVHASHESDQSISDEDEIEIQNSDRCDVLDGPSRRKEPNFGLQFDLLSGVLQAKERRKRIADKTNAAFSSEDEPEMPEIDYAASVNATSLLKIHKKLISDVQQPPELNGLSFIEGVKTADRMASDQLNILHDHLRQQQVNQPSMPVEDLASHESPPLEESLLAVEYDSLEEAALPVEGLQAKIIHESEDMISGKAFGKHENGKNSMADLLDGLQEKNCGSYVKMKRVGRKGRKRKVDIKRKTLLTEEGTVKDEDPCDIIDSGSSSDNESKDQIVLPTKAEASRKTIADQFQEAFGATSLTEDTFHLIPKQLRTFSSGLYDQLQRVIQREKENNLDFMKNLRLKTLADEFGYLDVKLLSRSFEAKLTQCVCLINCYKKSSILAEKSEEEMLMLGTRTIIFTSWTCGDVELHAGNYVRVYPPWKVVQVQGGNIIILASYFTQIMT